MGWHEVPIKFHENPLIGFKIIRETRQSTDGQGDIIPCLSLQSRLKGKRYDPTCWSTAISPSPNCFATGGWSVSQSVHHDIEPPVGHMTIFLKCVRSDHYGASSHEAPSVTRQVCQHSSCL